MTESSEGDRTRGQGKPKIYPVHTKEFRAVCPRNAEHAGARVVGYSGKDRKIRRCVCDTCGTVWAQEGPKPGTSGKEHIDALPPISKGWA